MTESSIITNVSIDVVTHMEEHVLVQPRSIVVLFLFLLIIAIGVPGNVLIIAVFWTKPRRTSTAVLIMALAVTDLVSCLVRIPDAVLVAQQLDGTHPSYTAYFAITLANNLLLTVVNGLAALIAFDRYDCVCRHNKRLLTHKRSRAAVVLVLCLTPITNIPAFLYALGNTGIFNVVLSKQVVFYSLDVVVVMICYGEVYAMIRRHVRVGFARKRVEQSGGSDSLGWTPTGAVPTGLPSTTADGNEMQEVACTATDQAPDTASSIARTVSVHHNQDAIAVVSGQPLLSRTPGPRQESLEVMRPRKPAGPSSTDLQRKTTRMLFSVTLIFLVTYIPYWIYVSFALSGRPHDEIVDVVYNLLNLLFLNNAVNPLIYGLVNRRFRKDIRDVLRKLCRRGAVPMEQ
ncbi:D(2) dopamine receptor-like [Asterias amurensis]|uniref:D(2) dopamine receptor-like n=1 Tax=Asterias amurensis TaxID=7602 RepID=UPI003AB14D37